ncbi:MAG: GAF domain-containing protein, partial [Cyclobacteriaceae bacterium]
MSVLNYKSNNLRQLFSLKTLKGRFVWLAIIFIITFLGFSLVMLFQKQKIENKLSQVLDFRLQIRKDLEDLSDISSNLVSAARNSILKRLPFDQDKEGNYRQYPQAFAILNKLDSLKNYFPDSASKVIVSINEIHEQFNQDFIRADSIWDENHNYYRLLNVRDNLLDQASIVYELNDSFKESIASDTLKITSIEAEDGFYSGAFINYSHGGYEGSGYADYVNPTEDFLEFSFLSEKSGNHLIYYRYALSKGERPLNIFLDDQLVVEQFPIVSLSRSWDTWNYSDTISLPLDSGIHKLKAVATGKSGPNIDKVYIISPAGSQHNLHTPELFTAIPDTLIDDYFKGKLFSLYRQEVNTMSAVEDILRASLSVMQVNLKKLSTINKNMIKADKSALKKTLQQTNVINMSVLALIIIIAFIVIYFTIKSLNNSLQHPLNLMKNLAAGDITLKAPNTEDEFNQVIEAGNVLRDHLQKASEFAYKIGEGDLNSDFRPGSDKDVLGKALLQMRDKLKAIADEDQKNNWSSRGITLFADMVRKHFDTMEDFSAIAISQLVKYIDAKLGMLYIKNDEDAEHMVLELTGCYTYDRNKFLENTIEPGIGYTGQVFLEKETVYITDLPEDYVKIGSSLGETPPRSLLVVPMIANDAIEGVLEIASLKKYEQYQIAFVEKVAEIFATHI